LGNATVELEQNVCSKNQKHGITLTDNVIATVQDNACNANILVEGLALRSVPVSIEQYRRALLLAFICWVAFGPVVVALTPPLIAYR
jgi:hypothetical protein